MKKLFTLILGVSALASCCCQPQKEIGLELYSIRDLIGNPELYAENQATVLPQLAEMGYTHVEAANYNNGKFYGVEPEQFKADVENAGLQVLSSHVGHGLTAEELASGDFTEAMKWWDQAIEAHKLAGMQYMITPGFAVPNNLKDLKTYCDYFNEIGRRVKEAGMSYGYHNHSHEFNKVEDAVIYDFMLENTDPELVFFQMDVYWAVMGRVSPVEYFKNNPGRFPVLHIKDYSALGQSGMVGFDAIFNNFNISGTEHIVVEIEYSTCGDIMQSCKESAEYLLNADFVK